LVFHAFIVCRALAIPCNDKEKPVHWQQIDQFYIIRKPTQMPKIQELLTNVESARQALITEASGLSHSQANFKPTPESWSIVEIVEHIVRAEQSGISGLWKAWDGLNRGEPVWEGYPVHKGLSADEIISKTWQAKEIVPPIAAPQWGGSLNFWLAMLKGQKYMLAELAAELAEFPLETLIYPHPISGPMDAAQRFDFLRVHMLRHQKQIRDIKQDPNFPNH